MYSLNQLYTVYEQNTHGEGEGDKGRGTLSSLKQSYSNCFKAFRGTHFDSLEEGRTHREKII